MNTFMELQERARRAEGADATNTVVEVCDETIPPGLKDILIGIADQLAEEFPETRGRISFSYDENKSSKVSVDPDGKFAHVRIGGKDVRVASEVTEGSLAAVASHEGYLHGGPDLTSIRSGRSPASERQQHINTFSPAGPDNPYFQFICKTAQKVFKQDDIKAKAQYFQEYAEDVSFHLMDQDSVLSEEAEEEAYDWHAELEEAAEYPHDEMWQPHQPNMAQAAGG